MLRPFFTDSFSYKKHLHVFDVREIYYNIPYIIFKKQQLYGLVNT